MTHLMIVHQVFVSPKEAGGTRHYEFARHLVNDGEQCTIIASDVSYVTNKRVTDKPRLVTDQDIDGVRVLRAYTYQSFHQNLLLRVVAFLSFMFTSVWAGIRAGKVDVVMGTSPPIFQGLSAWIISRLRRKPFLMEIRDLWPEFAIDIGVLKNPVLIWGARRLESFLYARADHLLVNSPAYRDYLINRGVPSHKVTLIPNGVDPDVFDPRLDATQQRTELGIHDKFIVMYAGALGMANDLSTLLRAAKRLQHEPGIFFVIMGDGAERPNLEKEAQELGLTNLYFLGARPKSEVPAGLAMADACIATLKNIPMFTTTYPNKIFDYMAAGKPIVLGIDGVIRKVVEEAEAGIFAAPGDDEAIANVILHLYKNQEAAHRMGANGRVHVEAHFNRHKHGDEFKALIRRVSEGQ